MKNLNKYIQESLLDDEDILIDDKSIEIEQFLKDNYIFSETWDGKGGYEIIGNVVNADLVNAKRDITHITNGLFTWGEVNVFSCASCKKLVSLEGCPQKIKYTFDCWGCKSLKNLKGCPKYLNGSFDCSGCDNLIDLKGAPEIVNGDFQCRNCKKLSSINGIPKEIGGNFDCSDNRKLNKDGLLDEIKRKCNVKKDISI